MAVGAVDIHIDVCALCRSSHCIVHYHPVGIAVALDFQLPSAIAARGTMTKVHAGDAGKWRSDDIRISAFAAHQIAAGPVGELFCVLVGGTDLCVEDGKGERLMAILR